MVHVGQASVGTKELHKIFSQTLCNPLHLPARSRSPHLGNMDGPFLPVAEEERVWAWCMNKLIQDMVCKPGREGSTTAVPIRAAPKDRGEEKPSLQGAYLLDGVGSSLCERKMAQGYMVLLAGIWPVGQDLEGDLEDWRLGSPR